MITIKKGRARSVRTKDETEELLKADFARLTKAERETLKVILAEMRNQQAVPAGEKSLLDVISGAEYKTPPVDIRTFVKDPYFLGKSCSNIYPKLLDDLVELFEGGYQEAILSGSIGWGKCIHGTTEIYDVGAGRRRRADELGEFHVAAVDVDAKQVVARASNSFASGRKPCVRVTLRGGQQIVLSEDHPVLTSRGWVEAAKLSMADVVATPARMPAPLSPLAVSDDEVKLVAYLLGDGGCTQTSTTFTNADPRLLKEFADIVERLGDPSQYDKYHQWLSKTGVVETKSQTSGKATSVRARGVAHIVKAYGLREHSRDKRVPAEFYGLSDEQVALFLNRFLACDGTITAKSPQMIEVTLASEGLVDDLRFLLLRLGVPSRKYKKTAGYRLPDGTRKTFMAWRLRVFGQNIKKLLAATGPILGKEERSAAAVDSLCVPGPTKFRQEGDLIWDRLKSVESVGECDVFDLSVDRDHNFIGNGVVLHNTYFASIGLCWVLYQISCLRDPHASYGIEADTNIALVAFSVNAELAQKVAFENIVQKIKASPYFQQNFPFEPTKKEFRFPGNVWIAPRATTDTSALGLNIISAFLDETDFMASKKTVLGEQSKADTIYAQVQRRMKSRFERQGKLPGMLFVVSSKKTNEDFTQKRIKDSLHDPSIFVRDYATWDVKPEDYFHAKRFWVLCGNADIGSKILTDEEYEKYKNNVPEGAVLVDVPEDFRADFERDLEGAIRDMAGIATVAIRPYIQRREKIREAIESSPHLSHPFSTEVYDLSRGGTFVWSRMVSPRRERAPGRVEFERLRPLINPTAPRHIHIDIGLRKDGLGFAMSHVSGWKDVVRRSDEGREFLEKAPVYTVDCVLRVVPPVGGEILLSEVRHLVYDIIDHGYLVTSISFDSYQSVDSIQMFQQRGLNAQTVSVDTDPLPYDTLKMALYENRIHMYDYPTLTHELRMLQEDFSGRKRKIDHPRNGSKDVSDALAGTIFTLSQQKIVQPLPILRGTSYVQNTWMEEQRQSAMAGNRSAGDQPLMPFYVGGITGGGWNDPWNP